MTQAINRKSFYRTDISLKEKGIGGLIILLLAVIAIGVMVKGRSFDPTKYTGDIAAMESTRQAVEGKAATLQGELDLRANEMASTAETPSASRPERVLPAMVENLEPMGPTEVYTEATLYEKINGRAPAYFEYNFVELKARSFSIKDSSGDYLDVFLYRMDSPINAFGIFSAERDPSGLPLEFAEDGYLSGMGYFARKGPVYIQVLASSESPGVLATAEACTRELVKSLPGNNSGMEGRSALPAENQIPGSLTYINENAYGQEVLNSVFEARYTVNEVEFSSFAQQAEGPEIARDNWETLREFYTKYGNLDEEFVSNGAAVFVGEVFGEWNVIYNLDTIVSGVVNASDREVAVNFIKSQLGDTDSTAPEEAYPY